MTYEKEPGESKVSWVPIREAQPDGYWLKLNTTGLPERDRASINLVELEDIFRKANLPPVLITTESWNPKSFTVPEGTGHTLALKQISFVPRVPTLTDSHESNFSISPSDPGSGDKSFGWELRIKTNKIDHDIRMKYPRDGDKHTALFYKEWESSVRAGIRLLGIHETSGTRYLSQASKKDHLSKLAMQDVFFSSFGGSLLNEAITSWSSKSVSYIAGSIATSELKGRAEVSAMLADNEDRKERIDKTGNIPDAEVSFMRQSIYPERYAQEKHGSGVRFASRLLPGGLMAEPAILAYYSLLTHPESFVKVSSKR